MKSVFNYRDFRIFLGDYYRYRKSQDAVFSHRRFTRNAAIASPNYLKLVIQGKRSLTSPLLFRFAKGIGLDFFETQYFESLVHHNQARDEAERHYYTQRLKQLKRNKPKAGVSIAKSQLSFEWYVPLVRLLVEGRTVEEAPRWVKSQLGGEIAVDEILSELAANGSITVENDRYALGELFTQYRDKSGRKVSFEQYTFRHLEHMMNNFTRVYPKGRFICHSFTVDKNRFEFFSSLLSRFILELNRHTEGEPAERLMQLNVQLFPFEGEIRR